ncbi:1,6-anhydro-N-acetylmuramyl-L-alanine amidase AmpD [Gammaproteobacteria bacterium]|nr:1,6-anhydro-N-acetylmuramyl-L-alanine amidase AmpD [Gammaproteobacteria bacterium]|tara:strand:- start:295 stop:834 length:540 start_codon:yes stop_codon:yes gene_type:complete
MKIKNHRLQDINFLESPNFNDRPVDEDISLLVIHSISLPPKKYNTDHIERFFLNELDFSLHDFYKNIDGIKVSAHVLIKRNGEIIQFVPFNKRAWHAGVSSYKGKNDCNDFSIGIELEGSDDDIFEDIQYEQLSLITSLLITEYDLITKDNIKGHSDIAPERKTDPGVLFDWDRYLTNV